MEHLSRRELRALSWAVGEAAAWRGLHIGCADGDLKAFDEEVATAKSALKKLRKTRKTNEHLRAGHEP